MSDDGAQSAAQYLGRTVGKGRFELRSILGVGGMASVYLAYDSVLDRQVAVKTLHTELGREQSFRERFRREAQAVAKLTHTNIVSVFDSGEDEIDGAMVPYIVMEYVEGKPLRGVLDEDIAQYGAMPTEKALKITGDVLAALETSHEMGLVHRDIKPGNVMVTKRGVVKVMDFGIARAMQSGVTSMTQTGMVVGTPQYLSPEQALGRGVDARSDIYSVGILLFELLTGRLPFDAESALAIAYAHVQEEAPIPSSVNRSVPPAVDGLVAQALKKNPDDRFPTAETMQHECARIGGSGAAPIIISGGPAANSGAGVGQAVFPPVNDVGTPPPPGSMQQPYPSPYGGFGPSTPPPGQMQQAHMAQGYPTPNPNMMGPPHQHGQQPTATHTPPPYAMGPQSGGPGGGRSGGSRNTPLIAGSAIVALVAVVLVIVALNNSGGGDTPAAGTGSASSVPGAEVPAAGGDSSASGGGDPEMETEGAEGDAETAPETDTGSDTGGSDDSGDITPEDKSKTIEATKCTDATESYSDKSKILLPDFTTKNYSSVKACMDAAGWKLGELSYEDEDVWGKNAVMDQSPEDFSEFDKKSDKIDLTLSTGKSD